MFSGKNTQPTMDAKVGEKIDAGAQELCAMFRDLKRISSRIAANTIQRSPTTRTMLKSDPDYDRFQFITSTYPEWGKKLAECPNWNRKLTDVFAWITYLQLDVFFNSVGHAIQPIENLSMEQDCIQLSYTQAVFMGHVKKLIQDNIHGYQPFEGYLAYACAEKEIPKLIPKNPNEFPAHLNGNPGYEIFQTSLPDPLLKFTNFRYADGRLPLIGILLQSIGQFANALYVNDKENFYLRATANPVLYPEKYKAFYQPIKSAILATFNELQRHIGLSPALANIVWDYAYYRDDEIYNETTLIMQGDSKTIKKTKSLSVLALSLAAHLFKAYLPKIAIQSEDMRMIPRRGTMLLSLFKYPYDSCRTIKKLNRCMRILLQIVTENSVSENDYLFLQQIRTAFIDPQEYAVITQLVTDKKLGEKQLLTDAPRIGLLEPLQLMGGEISLQKLKAKSAVELKKEFGDNQPFFELLYKLGLPQAKELVTNPQVKDENLFRFMLDRILLLVDVKPEKEKIMQLQSQPAP